MLTQVRILPSAINVITMKTGTPNEHLQALIDAMLKEAIVKKAPIWKAVADDLRMASRQRRVVNISRLNRFTEADEIIVVPGKVLGSGLINHKLTVAAVSFSEGAKQRIHDAKGHCISFAELMQKYPDGHKLRVLG